MTAKTVMDRAQRRHWTFDKIAYGVISFISAATYFRVQGFGDTVLQLATWANVVGEHLHIPFR